MGTTNHWQSRKLMQALLEEACRAISAADLQFAVIDRIMRCWCQRPKRILDQKPEGLLIRSGDEICTILLNVQMEEFLVEISAHLKVLPVLQDSPF